MLNGEERGSRGVFPCGCRFHGNNFSQWYMAMYSPWASMSSSTIFAMSSMESSAAVWGSSMTARRISSFLRVRAASIVQQLGVDVGHVSSPPARGGACLHRWDGPGAIDQAGNLYTGLLREVFDQVAGVQHVAANLNRAPGDDRLHDVRGVFLGTLVGQLCVRQKLLTSFPSSP